jgi:arsenical pump membrane protein
VDEQSSVSQAFIALVAVAAICAVLTRPRGISEGVWAFGAGLLLVVTGRLSLADVGDVLRDLAGVVTFLVGLFWITLAARQAGIFDRAARLVVNAASGSGTRLMVAVFAFGTLTTAFLSNDAESCW